jgi:hypothetical protein
VIEKEFAVKQIARFSGLINFPDGREAKQELVSALQNFATQELASAFVSDWISSESLSPLPVSIRRGAFEANERENTSWLEKKKCPECYGSGYRLEKRRVRALPQMPEREYEYAVKCVCVGGTAA